MNMMNEQELLFSALSELRLKHFAAAMKTDFSTLEPKEQNLFITHFKKWLEMERSERKASLINSRIRSAKFNQIQTVDTYDFNYNKSTQALQKTYISLHNSISPKELPCAIFTGTAGLGKTHLARALGYAACQKGISVLFVTAAEMVNNLAYAQKAFNIENELKKFKRSQILILDELGYVSLDVQASNLFFQVISARHDLGLGTIATTNLPFGKFNQIFANDAIAHAIVDRLANSAEIFYLEGPSYREYQREQKNKKRGK